MPNFDFFSLVQQCGFPIALAVVCGWFIMQAIALVLGSVVKSIKKITGLLRSMDGRVRQMNVDILDLDKLVSQSLEVDALPVKVHHEVAAAMNNNGEKSVVAPPTPKKSIKDKIRESVENVVDKNVEKILDKVENITK